MSIYAVPVYIAGIIVAFIVVHGGAWRKRLDIAFSGAAIMFVLLGALLDQKGMKDQIMQQYATSGSGVSWAYLPPETFDMPFGLAAGFGIGAIVVYAFSVWRRYVARQRGEMQDAENVKKATLAAQAAKGSTQGHSQT